MMHLSSSLFVIILFSVLVCDGMKIAERYSYQFKNKFGTYDTKYQYFAAKKKGNTFPFSNQNQPAILCIHGFGGNADQFRKNLPVFSNTGYDAYALDLLGYGYGDKPDPKQYEVNELYNFDTWAEQISSFVRDVVKKPVILVCNSVGGVAGLQCSLKYDPKSFVRGVVLIDISLRLLHKKKQNPLQRAVVPIIQQVLRESSAGRYFFKQVATPQALKNILNNAYGYPDKSKDGVTDETVDIILQPGLDPGAVNVFLDFISYSGGPLPEELLSQTKIPVSILWGMNDPWEPMDLAIKAFSNYPCVIEFVPLPGGGHCPMDQIPDIVNAEVLRIVEGNFKKLSTNRLVKEEVLV